MTDVRVKRLGTLTADTGGEFDSYFDFAGTLESVEFIAGNFGTTGSLFLNISGTNLTIWSMISGTATGNVGTNFLSAVRATPKDSTNTDISNSSEKYTLANGLHLVGSGCGNTKSGLGFNIYYT